MDDLKTLDERSRCGDLDAFSGIVTRFQDMAIGYAEAMVGDFHGAEDVAQEAFIDAYLKLPELRDAAAFPGWFRKIVWTHCNRALRKRRVETIPLEEAVHVTHSGTAKAELHEEVLAALRALPEPQRVTTTLFYINGYSQNEIAEFLEVPVTTVQKRLHDSRKKLKERMMEMVEETLKDHAPDERFSQAVITQLLGRPKLLEIEGHPVRMAAEAIRAVLPDYERMEGDEVLDKSSAASLLTYPDKAYHMGRDRILRTETTVTAFQAAVGRTPPVRLLVCGRVFRPDEEDTRRLKVFHQLDVLHIAENVTEELMHATLRKALESVLGSVEFRHVPNDYPVTENGFEVQVSQEGRWIGVAGAGMVAREFLARSGFPDTVKGFSFGVGLERLAMIQHGIDDIRRLWQPPYVPLR